MYELTVQQHPVFGNIRMLMENGRRLTCGSDAAKALQYARPSEAVAAHCPHTVKRRIGVQTGMKADGTPAIQDVEMLFIPDGDLYRLIAHSKMPAAVQFESWIFDEIVPEVVDTGSYIAPGVLPAHDAVLTKEVEARYNNSLVRKAAELRRLADNAGYPVEYKQILYSKAAEILAGQTLLPLPEAPCQTYTAAEVAERYNLSAQMIGRLANQHDLKTDRYGMYVWSKSPYSAKEVRSFVYYDTIFDALDEIV